MKLAVFGGTFNPIHYGHLFLAEEIYHAFGFEKIIFVPSFIPAHKTVPADISAKDRLMMCRRALNGYPHFLLDDCEIKRGGVSYMIDTVDAVTRHYSVQGKIALVIGDDLAGSFSSWKHAQELARRTRIIVVRRHSVTHLALTFDHEYFDNKIIPLSSSEIRERVGQGRPVRFLVPEKVYAWIKTRKLYRNSNNV